MRRDKTTNRNLRAQQTSSASVKRVSLVSLSYEKLSLIVMREILDTNSEFES